MQVKGYIDKYWYVFSLAVALSHLQIQHLGHSTYDTYVLSRLPVVADHSIPWTLPLPIICDLSRSGLYKACLQMISYLQDGLLSG
jgi:hypothetical protein